MEGLLLKVLRMLQIRERLTRQQLGILKDLLHIVVVYVFEVAPFEVLGGKPAHQVQQPRNRVRRVHLHFIKMQKNLPYDKILQ